MSDETANLGRAVGASHARPEETVVRPSPHRSWRSSHIALLLLAVAAGSFLVGIALAAAGRPRAEETVVASQRVGPSGGVVRFDGGEINVPDGALDQVERFIVHRSVVRDRITVEADRPLDVGSGRLFAYRFEPDDVTFDQPVELTFSLPDNARNAAVFARHDGRVILLTGRIDPDRRTATTSVRDFGFGSGNR